MRVLFLSLVCLAGACHAPATARNPVARVEEFRAACAAEDLDRARAFLAADPREWYERHEGPGEPWTLGAGRWKTWDAYFRSRSTPGPWRVEGSAVSADVSEINDYYRLTERGPQRYRQTYFLDSDGQIEGTLIASLPSSGAQRMHAMLERWRAAVGLPALAVDSR